MQHSNRINLRLTDFEKQEWAKAAGGTRKLSEWIRATCNAAAVSGALASNDVDAVEELVALGAEQKRQAAKVSIGGNGVLIPPTSTQVTPSAGTEECPRWMHHRKGRYCGACKKVAK